MAVQVATDHPMFIDGGPAESSGGGWLEVHSPATGELVGRVPAGTEADVDRAVAAARAAFRDGRWHRMGLADRVAVMNRLADLCDEQRRRARPDRDAPDRDRLQAPTRVGPGLRLGQPPLLRDGDPAPRGQGRLRVHRDHTSMVRREPIGVVGQVAPWNYPFWMAIWKVGPALAAGNSIVLKPPAPPRSRRSGWPSWPRRRGSPTASSTSSPVGAMSSVRRSPPTATWTSSR